MTRPPASMLWFLYVAAGLGCPDIGRIYRRDPSTIRLWLVGAGIQTRPRGSDKRQWLKSGHRMNLGRKRSREERLAIRAATIRRGGVPYLRNGKHWLHTVPPEQNPNWRGGATPERQEFYRSPEWRSACCAVWKRANACCERCGLDFRTVDRKRVGAFHVHHIVRFEVRELRAEPSNLALLCRPCHLWVHSAANVEREFHRDAIWYCQQAEQQRATPSLFDLEEAA